MAATEVHPTHVQLKALPPRSLRRVEDCARVAHRVDPDQHADPRGGRLQSICDGASVAGSRLAVVHVDSTRRGGHLQDPRDKEATVRVP